MKRSRTNVIEQDGKYFLVMALDHKPNLDHIETVSGSESQFYVDWEIADPRKARPQQRRLFFALINDINRQLVVPTDFLKDMFYTEYSEFTGGKSVSLADDSQSTVSEVNQLLDLVIDFMFEWHIEFKRGYELLPRDQGYFLFECCRHRRCMICHEHADIHHVDVVGMGANRDTLDHTKRHVMPLCRKHHSEIEQIGAQAFSRKYHVPVTGIKLDVTTLKKIGVRGNYKNEEINKL